MTQTPGDLWSDFLKLNQTAKVEAYPVLVNDFTKEVTGEPSEAEILAIYEQGKNQVASPVYPEPGFMREYKANFEYVEGNFSERVEAEKSKITEEQIKTEYDRLVSLGQLKFDPELEKLKAPKAPATDTPATEAPATEKPATETKPEDAKPETPAAPATDAPAPTTPAPTTSAPATETPAAPAPETPAAPAPEKPATETPAAPATETPATETPATDKPATPVPETPATENACRRTTCCTGAEEPIFNDECLESASRFNARRNKARSRNTCC